MTPADAKADAKEVGKAGAREVEKAQTVAVPELPRDPRLPAEGRKAVERADIKSPRRDLDAVDQTREVIIPTLQGGNTRR